jgi:molybdopterin synthase catalytic subunit
MSAVRIQVQAEDFDIGDEIERLKHSQPDVGAVVAFVGACRSDNGRLAALELEHYPGMAEHEIGRLVDEANSRWSLAGVTVIHRFGRIVPEENIVLVVTGSAHRKDAFAAAEFLMDFLKTEAPFWKKEHLAIPTNASDPSWVASHPDDVFSKNRWLRG